jgi:hypothetical protein
VPPGAASTIGAASGRSCSASSVGAPSSASATENRPIEGAVGVVAALRGQQR